MELAVAVSGRVAKSGVPCEGLRRGVGGPPGDSRIVPLPRVVDTQGTSPGG